MEFTQRGTHQSQQPVNVSGGEVSNGHHRRGRRSGFSWIRLGMVLLLFSATILIVALLISIATGKTPSQETKYVKTNELQAVFLNGGQVYFGNIKTLNDKFIRMDNIYYLRVNQTVQPKGTTTPANNDISLVKLGCELHGPEDEMVINRPQIIFWENLKSSSQVAKAVAQYVKQNPNGQTCTTTGSTSTSTGTSATGQ